jgi:myo-inositol-1(or 4)-monophosphatase
MARVSPGQTADVDWLGACRRARAGLQQVLQDHPTSVERVIETGVRGEGGDQTLAIDQAAEDAVFALLDELHAQGHRFCAISEERGVVDYGSQDVRVVVDPLDGSLNAKRALSHHAISIAVADGPTMADVAFGYVYDYGPGEEWVARRGQGATLDGERVDRELGEHRDEQGRLEVLGLESADPRWIAEVADVLPDHARRVRALGSIAVTLCQVAGARLDAMITLKRTRAVDAAAGQLVVREAGGHVAFPGCETPLGAPLDVAPRFPMVAARTERTLAELVEVPIR